MGRPLRFLPHPNTTFEITTRTIQGRLLLKPSEDLNDLVLGVLGRSLSLYPSVLLHLFVVSSNHIHIILTVPDSKTLSLFMCVRALRDGKMLSGTWFDRTKEYEARRAGEDLDPLQFATRYDVVLSPLPCWANLPACELQRRSQELLSNLESEIHQGHLQAGRRSVLGKRELLAQDPHRRPEKVKKSKAPSCHSSSVEKWCDYRNSYRFFADVFRMAAKKLKKQKPPVLFPEHCFMPSVGYFVPAPVGTG